MDNVRPRASYSPIKRSYYTKPAFRPKNLKQDVKTSRVKNMTTAGTRAVVNTGKGKMDNDLKKSRWVWRPKGNYMDHESKEKGSFILKKFEYGNPKICLHDHAVVDSGFSSHMTSNKAYVSDYEDYNGGFVAFGSDPKGAALVQGRQVSRLLCCTVCKCILVGRWINFVLLVQKLILLGLVCAAQKYFTMEMMFGLGNKMLLGLVLEAINGKPPSISFMRPFGCPLTILNTLDPLGKFDGKSDEGYLLGYSTTSKAFRVYNKRTKRVEENMHIDFLEDQPNVAGSGPDWMFDLDFLTNTMNYIPVSVENQVNVDAGTQEHYVAGSSEKDKEPTQEYILLPLHPHRPRISVEDVVQAAQEKPSETSPKDTAVQDSEDVAEKEEQHMLTEADQALKDDLERMIAQEIVAKTMDDATRQAFEEEKKRAAQATSINKLNTGRPSVGASNSPLVSTANTPYASAASTPTGANTEDDSNVFPNDGIFSGAYDDEDVGAEADFNNMDNTIDVSPIPTLRVHKDHPKGQILGDPKSAVQTRGKIQKASSVQQALVSYIYNQNRTNHKDHQNCLLACFLSQEEPKTISQALKDESWVEAMQEELLQFKLQWFDNLLSCIWEKGLRQSEEVYIYQPPGIVDLAHPNKVYKERATTRKGEATTLLCQICTLVKDEDGIDVDAHVYRYLKHQPKLGLRYPRDSPFELEAFLDIDYGGASLDRKSTTVKNPVYHSRTKHIEIRHHFIRDCYEKRLIDVIKIHTDANVADLLTKGFDVTRFNFLVIVKMRLMIWDFILLIEEFEANMLMSYASAASLVNTARPTLSTTRLGKFDVVMQIWCCQANLVLSGKFNVARQIWYYQFSMANLEFVDQHNMVACLEKTEGNSDFHEIVDFLASSSIHHALTVSPTIYTSYIEQFWNTASSQTVNDVKQINATIDSKAVVVTEASIRTRKSIVFSNMSRKGVKFSGKVTPLFDSMLVPHQAPEGEDSKYSLKGTNGNEGDHVQTPHDSPLSGGHTSDRAEGVLNLHELSNQEVRKEVQAKHLTPHGMVKECEQIIHEEEIWKEGVYHGIEYMETEEAVDEGRQSGETEEVKLTDDTEVVEDKSSDIDADRQEDSVVEPRTTPTTTSIFDDEDITMAQTLIKMKEEKAKEKGVPIKDVDDSSRPARSILTLKPLPTIDPKDKGKGVLKESPELAEMEREREERQRQDQASVDYIASLYDEVQAKMDASKERKKLLAEERAAAVRNKPPTRTQLRSLMMTYLKHTGKYRHNQLNKKTFEEIQALYIKEQERDADFVPIGSERDEKMIDKMNKKAAGMDEEEVPEEPESTKVEVKQEGREENIRKRSGRRLKMKATKKSKRKKTDSDLEEEEQLRASLKIVPDEE
ncbi:ribonuclease H-like domain-containing protein [Tanacetum coccineum]